MRIMNKPVTTIEIALKGVAHMIEHLNPIRNKDVYVENVYDAIDYIEKLKCYYVTMKARCDALENDLINSELNLKIMTERCEALERVLKNDCYYCAYRDEPKPGCREIQKLAMQHKCNNWEFCYNRDKGDIADGEA